MVCRANCVNSYVGCKIYCISRVYMKELVSKMVQQSSINLQLMGEGVLSRFAARNVGDILCRLLIKFVHSVEVPSNGDISAIRY